jgi:RNA polymerase sigma factor (sigma-70 family)
MPSPCHTHIDTGTWQRLLNGDKEALYELYEACYHILFFTGIKQIHDADLVKDVIQQQFLYFWEKRGSLGEVRNVKSYIIISFLRRLTNDWVYSRKSINLEVAWSEKEEELFETSYEETIIRKDYDESLHRKMEAVINSLPARQRELIILKFYEGMDYEAIVQKTGLAHRTVYNKIHEALCKIRQQLEQSPILSGIKMLIIILSPLFW